MKKDVKKALAILGDILLNSKLDESAIVRERDVILREMEEVRQQLLLVSSASSSTAAACSCYRLSSNTVNCCCVCIP
jgi:predicted Zn-dependent peptidase